MKARLARPEVSWYRETAMAGAARHAGERAKAGGRFGSANVSRCTPSLLKRLRLTSVDSGADHDCATASGDSDRHGLERRAPAPVHHPRLSTIMLTISRHRAPALARSLRAGDAERATRAGVMCGHGRYTGAGSSLVSTGQASTCPNRPERLQPAALLRFEIDLTTTRPPIITASDIKVVIVPSA